MFYLCGCLSVCVVIPSFVCVVFFVSMFACVVNAVFVCLCVCVCWCMCVCLVMRSVFVVCLLSM